MTWQQVKHTEMRCSSRISPESTFFSNMQHLLQNYKLVDLFAALITYGIYWNLEGNFMTS